VSEQVSEQLKAVAWATTTALAKGGVLVVVWGQELVRARELVREPALGLAMGSSSLAHIRG
jgi:putative effector of murein hydrolase